MSLVITCLAELEVHHSRPIAPTRRLALGEQNLPLEPEPGPGAILLAGIVARYLPEVDESFHDDYLLLLSQLEQGEHTAQPRLRHRLQTDCVGLTRSTHRLERHNDELELVFKSDRYRPEQHVLAAAYAAGDLPHSKRPLVMDLMRKAERWRGSIDARLISYLSGNSHQLISAYGHLDPKSWAMNTLGFEQLTLSQMPVREEIQQRFRDRLKSAHPDTGGQHSDAARLIADLSQARKILLG